MRKFILHTPIQTTYQMEGSTPHAALKTFCDNILTEAPQARALMPNGDGEWLVYMYVAPGWKGTHRITEVTVIP